MAIQGFCPPSPPSHSPSHSPSPYYQLLERSSARLGRVKKLKNAKLEKLIDRKKFQNFEICGFKKSLSIRIFQL